MKAFPIIREPPALRIESGKNKDQRFHWMIFKRDRHGNIILGREFVRMQLCRQRATVVSNRQGILVNVFGWNLVTADDAIVGVGAGYHGNRPMLSSAKL